MKLRSIIFLGLAWSIIVTGFQWVVSNRLHPLLPDYVLSWTKYETAPDKSRRRFYLAEPVMNNAVAWDSEYYLSIAIKGYDDPLVGSVKANGRTISKNYAFLPFYPLLIKITALPFNLFMKPVAAAALAGTLISLMGTMAAALALFFLAGDHENASGAWKTVFYFLIFPSSFILAQVYTEGLFLGLSFGALALNKHKKNGWAALLAMLAVWTRITGIFLAVPLLWSWFNNRGEKPLSRFVIDLLYAIVPAAAFLLWYLSPLGKKFGLVETLFFHRQPLNLIYAFDNWFKAFLSIFKGVPETRIYYLIEFSAIIYGTAACCLTIKKYPALSIYGLLIIMISLTSGESQGMSRYILAAPSIFILLGKLGESSPVFDRSWTIASLLLFGMMLSLYTFNMWVG